MPTTTRRLVNVISKIVAESRNVELDQALEDVLLTIMDGNGRLTREFGSKLVNELADVLGIDDMPEEIETTPPTPSGCEGEFAN